MNRKIALALVLASTAAGAFADDISADPQPFASTATRAQVLQELNEYRRAGMNPYADEYNPLMQFRGERSRQEVMQEFIQSRDSVAAFTGEDSGSFHLARQVPMHEPAPQLAVEPGTQLAGSPERDE